MANLRLMISFVNELHGWKRNLVATLSGALAALGLPPFNIVLVLILSLTVLVWLLDGVVAQGKLNNHSSKTIKYKAALVGWRYGFGYFLAGLYWIGFAFLVEAEQLAWMIPFVAVLMPGGLALFIAMATGVAITFWKPGISRLILLALCLALVEWLRGHILTGFPWNLFGYTWAGSLELSQSVSLFGIYGLTLLTLLLGVSPASFAAHESQSARPWAFPVFMVMLFALLWGFGAWRLSTHPTTYVEGTKFRLVQPSIPQVEKWKPGNRQSIFELYLELTQAEGFEDITHVVWPESAVPYILSREPLKVDRIGAMLGSDKILMTGSVRFDQNVQLGTRDFYNSLHVISQSTEEAERGKLIPRGQILSTYDKFHLVPFGEYLPLEGILEKVGLKQMVFGDGGYSSGPGLVTLQAPGVPPFSPLICYEILFPGRVIEESQEPEWILNLTNDAWFGDTSGPRQHLEMVRYRAIETGRPVVRSANNGISAIIDPLGRKLKTFSLNETGVVDGSLPNRISAPLYARIGDLIFIVLAGALFVIYASYRRKF